MVVLRTFRTRQRFLIFPTSFFFFFFLFFCFLCLFWRRIVSYFGLGCSWEKNRINIYISIQASLEFMSSNSEADDSFSSTVWLQYRYLAREKLSCWLKCFKWLYIRQLPGTGVVTVSLYWSTHKCLHVWVSLCARMSVCVCVCIYTAATSSSSMPVRSQLKLKLICRRFQCSRKRTATHAQKKMIFNLMKVL